MSWQTHFCHNQKKCKSERVKASDLEISGICTEVDRNEGRPDDTGRIHRECDVLGFIEILGNVPRLERIHGAQRDQHHVVHERHDDRDVGGLTAQDHRPPVWVSIRRVRQVHRDPGGRSDRLDSDQAEADCQLRLCSQDFWRT